MWPFQHKQPEPPPEPPRVVAPPTPLETRRRMYRDFHMLELRVRYAANGIVVWSEQGYRPCIVFTTPHEFAEFMAYYAERLAEKT